MIREIIRGLRNLLYWFPIIWHDRPWDYVFLYRMLRHKLASISDSIEFWLRVDNEEIKQRIDLAVQLLDDIIADAHEQRAAEAHERIFGKAEYRLVPFEGNELLSEFKVRYPEAQDQEAASRAFVGMMELAESINGFMVNMLFEIMKESRSWWD